MRPAGVEAFDAADAVCRGPGARLARVGSNLLCAGGVCREVPAEAEWTGTGGRPCHVERAGPGLRDANTRRPVLEEGGFDCNACFKEGHRSHERLPHKYSYTC